jgi:hypothetical protein
MGLQHISLSLSQHSPLFTTSHSFLHTVALLFAVELGHLQMGFLCRHHGCNATIMHGFNILLYADQLQKFLTGGRL